MAINFLSLKKSENDLNEQFLSLLKLSRKMYSRLITMIENKVVTQEDTEKMDNYRSRINESRRDIRDDCIWIISKDQPRANHLRFIIAVLYSIKDIERISDYAFTISNILKKEKITSSMIVNMTSLLEKAIIFYDKVIESLNSDDLELYEEELSTLFSQFRIDYKEFLTSNIKKFSKTNNLNQETFIEYYFNFSIVVKYIDRVVDHGMSIYKNFMMIKGN